MKMAQHSIPLSEVFIFLSWVTCLFFVTGEAWPQNNCIPTNHILMLRGDGTPLDPVTRKSIDVLIPGSPGTTYFDKHINKILTGIQSFQPDTCSDNVKKILIYVHGGRKTLKEAVARATSIYKDIMKENYYPVFVIWDANIWDSLIERYSSIRRGRKVNKLFGAVTSPFLIARTIASGIISMPMATIAQMTNDFEALSTDKTGTEKNVDSLYHALQKSYVTERQSFESIKVSWREEIRRGFWSDLGRNVLQIRNIGISWLLTPLIVGVGEEAWENLLRRTQTMFRRPDEFDIGSGLYETQFQRVLDSQPTGALSIFTRALSQSMQIDTQENETQYEITLIGHSMGAIILNEMIRSYDDLPYKNIVYMGAACSIRDLETSVIPYLQKDSTAQFYNLSLHPKAEKGEILYADLPQRGSLLTWIDNFYSKPKTHLDRTLGQWDNIIQATHIFPKEIRSQVTLKAFGLRPFALGTNPEKPIFTANHVGPIAHSEFNYYQFWRKKFWQVTPNEPPASFISERGGYAEGLFKLTRFRGDWVRLGSVRAAYLFNHTFAIGPSYHHLISQTNKLRVRYAGLDFDFVDRNLTTQTFFGYGFVQSKNPDTGAWQAKNWYYVLELTHSLMKNVTPWAQVGAGLGYRLAFGAKGLSSASFYLSLRLGRF